MISTSYSSSVIPSGTNGTPFGAFGGSDEMMARFDPRRADALPHSGTFNNNILTMTAGYVGLTEVFTPEACTALNAAGDVYRQAVAARKAKRRKQ